MLNAAWKSLLGRKVRLLLSAFSIVLGVAFVSGSLMLTNLLNSSFNEILKGAIADVNVTASGIPGFEGQANSVARLSPEVVAKVAAIPGVAQATGVVSAADLYPLNKQDKVLGFDGAPGIAMNWHTTPAAGGEVGARLVEGHAPAADNELVIDPSTMARGGFAVGDELKVSTPLAGIKTYRIVGTGTYGAGATAGASYLFFTLGEMQQLLTDGADEFTAMWISTQPEADSEAVTSAIQAVLPMGFNAQSGEAMAAELEDQLSVGLSFITTFLLVFAAIALVVAALLILNTFSILVAQRSRELALLRALGAKRAQVRNSVLFEAAVVSLVGATLGIAAGYGLTWLIAVALGAFGIDIGTAAPQLTWQAVVASYAVAVVITLVAAWLPARRASRARPVEAMTESALGGVDGVGTSALVGIGLIQLGIGAVVCGLWLNVPEPLAWAGVGSVAILVGCVLAAAVIGAPVVWLFGRLYRAAFGEIGKMAELNARRQPARTAATAATLMIGLSLVATVAILASSTTTSTRAGLTQTQRGDFIIAPVNYRPFNADVAEKAKAVPGVETVWTYWRGASALGEKAISLSGTTPAGVTDGSAVDVLAGELGESDNSALVSYRASKELDLPLGKTFRLPSPTGGAPVELLVTGIYDETTANRLWGDVVVNPTTYAQLGDAKLVQQVKVKLAPGADQAAARSGLEQTIADLPTVLLTDNEEFADARVAQFDTLFGVIYALLALAIVISVLGIVNTLGLSVMERRREIGLLRAVGLTRPQLRRLVTLESVIVAVLGSVLGVLLGVGFGAILVRLLKDNGITELAIPWGQLAVFVVLAALFGVVAAIGPARRAARQNVLDSIAMD